MRFMLLMIPGSYETAGPELDLPVDRVAEMMKFNESLQEAGVLLYCEGLHPPATGARVRFKGGVASVTDGPFAEAKELLGGFWMIDVRSRESMYTLMPRKTVLITSTNNSEVGSSTR